MVFVLCRCNIGCVHDCGMAGWDDEFVLWPFLRSMHFILNVKLPTGKWIDFIIHPRTLDSSLATPRMHTMGHHLGNWMGENMELLFQAAALHLFLLLVDEKQHWKYPPNLCSILLVAICTDRKSNAITEVDLMLERGRGMDTLLLAASYLFNLLFVLYMEPTCLKPYMG